MTIAFLRELHLHQAWADAEHWRFILACPKAEQDVDIRRRLHHLHLVQQAFLRVMRSEELDLQGLLQPPAKLGDLFPAVRQYHSSVESFITALTPEQLDRRVVAPWFDEGFNPTLAEALLQVTMHSHYHRGQNAMLIRQFGGTPVDTDYIVWVMKGRPAADWPA